MDYNHKKDEGLFLVSEWRVLFTKQFSLKMLYIHKNSFFPR